MFRVDSSKARELIIKRLLIIYFFTTIFFLFIFFSFANYGFDFTDEGYYLNSLEGVIRSQITYFAELIRPFYLILNKNIVNLRQLTILFTLLLGYLSLNITIRKSILFKKIFNDDNLKINLIIFLLCPVSIIGSSFLTPSYNNLCFYGMNLIYVSLLYFNSYYKNNFYYSFFLISGLTVLIFAKFTSAAIIVNKI